MNSLSGVSGVAREIAAFSQRFDASQLTDAQIHQCVRSLADTYGVAVAGRREDASQAALRYLGDAGLLHVSHVDGSDDGKTVGLWGTQQRAAPEIAAWWNGVTGHVLDYDDVTVPLRGHPSVVLWPALLALAETRDLPGSRVVSAFVVGLEVMCRLARGIAMAHYAKGWHSTASIGVMGTAAACAHLLGLAPGQMAHALGLAVAQAAGTRENVGTQSKSFQAGHACGAGVRAACLAEAGFEAGAKAIDGPHGYLRLYANSEDGLSLFAGLGDQTLELDKAGLDVKQYPMCYATHRVLDGVLDLREAHGLTLESVEQVDVLASKDALVPLVHPHPRCGLEGKFSLQYAVAAALADGAVRLSSFTDAAVRRPEIQAFFPRVHARESDGSATPRWAEVTLTLKDGRRLFQRVDALRGSHQKPVSDAGLVMKLDDCLSWAGFDGAGSALLQACAGLMSHRGRAAVERLRKSLNIGENK